MLSELRATQLGVIEDLGLLLGPGMTALTGETGAGKTLVVEAVELLVGGRADGMLVRPGADEAVVEGRFSAAGLPGPDADDGNDGDGADEVVVSRVVRADGRSRAYLDGRMATVGSLAEIGARLVDLHGQHAHQSLFSAAAQRGALDAFAGADRAGRDEAKAKLGRVEQAMAEVGGDHLARDREMELLRYQLAELEAAHLAGPDEDEQLAAEEDALAMATSHRAAAEAAYESLAGDEQLLDRLGQVIGGLSGHKPLDRLHDRLRGLAAELADAAAEARTAAEALEDDPERLAEVVARREVLQGLRRKYAGHGGTLADVVDWQGRSRARLEQLEGLGGLSARLAAEHEEVAGQLRRASEELGSVRREASGPFGRAVEAELRRLAMPGARFVVQVGGAGPEPAAGGGSLRDLSGEEVTFLLAANPGEPLLPLAKVASGGELARAMLALRLVLLGGAGGGGQDTGPGTLVFDEVDAGIGGEAALAVGRALAELGQRYQVVVVTHLAQVAAFAQAQVVVRKVDRDGRAVALAEEVTGEDRVVELSRMMSGQPGSETARRHAAELLRTAERLRNAEQSRHAVRPPRTAKPPNPSQAAVPEPSGPPPSRPR